MADEDFDDLDRLDPERLRQEMSKRDQAPKKEDDDGDVPAVKRIDIDVTDSRGKHYAGSVVYRVPAIGQQIEIGRMKAAMMPAGAPTDGDMAGMLCEMLCYLAVTLDKNSLPPWWKPHRFYDSTVVSFVYAQARAHHARFLGVADERGVDDEEAALGSGGDDLDAVERDVQPAAERRETLVSHADRSAEAGEREGGPRQSPKRRR